MSLAFVQETAVSLDDDELARVTALGCEAVIASGEITLRYFRQTTAVDNKSSDGFDPVTVADRECEQFLRKKLYRDLPHYGFYGEEAGYTAADSGLTWVVDPIDGTRSFISGVPLWGTLVGLSDGRRPISGIMYQPFTHELYFGNRLGGEVRHAGVSQRLACSGVERLAEAKLFCTSTEIFTPAELAAYERVAHAARQVRLGADCYAYCLLAAGCVDLVVESGLQCYDIYALIPIIESAGGVITSWDGGDPSLGGSVVAAATPALHAETLERLGP